jgi:Glyoxalase/Bleomycin resistance protein/Dioxygenase superfamily
MVTAVVEGETLRGQPLNHADLFHTGIVVDDLASAKEELGGSLGVTWRDGGAEVRLTGATGVRTVQTAYALSTSGPHHVELVQSIPGTLWSVAAPGHAHHLGYWVDDVPMAAAELVRLGSEQVASVAIKDGRPPMCTYHRSRSGLYLEIVDRRMRPILLPDP